MKKKHAKCNKKHDSPPLYTQNESITKALKKLQPQQNMQMQHKYENYVSQYNHEETIQNYTTTTNTYKKHENNGIVWDVKKNTHNTQSHMEHIITRYIYINRHIWIIINTTTHVCKQLCPIFICESKVTNETGWSHYKIRNNAAICALNHTHPHQQKQTHGTYKTKIVLPL